MEKLTENIGKAYEEADDIVKRNYLALFFKDFKIKNGRVIRFRLADRKRFGSCNTYWARQMGRSFGELRTGFRQIDWVTEIEYPELTLVLDPFDSLRVNTE